MSLGIILLSTAAIECFVLRRLKFDFFVIATVLAGTCLYVDYLSYTSVAVRNYDGPSHVEYIQSLASSLHLPDASSCVACGHPPLYYGLGAVWSKTALLGGLLPLELGLQWLSLLLFFAFIVVSLLLFRSCTQDTSTLRLATLLLVFWPSSIINSVRVHNDALAAPLMLAAMYFTAEWDKRSRARDFYAALVFAALAVATKASGYAVACSLLLFAALRLREPDERPLALRRLMIAVGVLGMTVLLTLASRVSRSPRSPCQAILGAACNGRYVPPLPDSPSRFMSFHLSDFVSRLAINPEDPVLNRFAKSTLFGVISLGDPFTDARHEWLARGLSAGLLVMALVCSLGLPLLGTASIRKNRVYVVSVAIMGLFLLAFRLRAPNEFHEDFRHIFAALAPFCLAYAAVVTRLNQYSKLASGVAIACALAMVALSAAFFA